VGLNFPRARGGLGGHRGAAGWASCCRAWWQPPSLAYNSFLIYKLDVEGQILMFQNELMDDVQWLGGYLQKMIEVSDGYLLAGGYREPLDGVNQRKAWIMKIDDDFEQEWYTELSYDDAPGNAHYPYDMEQTIDGGYALVGAYRNNADFYDRTWLVKVDACGDLEWQGCELPDGLADWEIQDSKFERYPNPVSGNEINIRFPQAVQLESAVLVDAIGRVHYLRLDGLRLNSSPQSEYNLKIRHELFQTLSGLYSLILTDVDGKVYSSKLVVE